MAISPLITPPGLYYRYVCPLHPSIEPPRRLYSIHFDGGFAGHYTDIFLIRNVKNDYSHAKIADLLLLKNKANIAVIQASVA